MLERRLGLGLAMGICAVWLATACGAGGSAGGGGITPTGGAKGTACNVKYNSQGCLGTMRTECVELPGAATPGAGTWAELGACAANQYCTQEANPADATKKLAVCKDVQSPVPDTVGGGDGDAGGDSKGPTVAELKTCMMSKCSTEWAACKADSAGCGLMGNCMEKCTDQACVDACPKVPDNNNQALALGMCMLSKGCMPSQPTGPVCGDSQCEDGETNANCPKDCPATSAKCGDGKCDSGETNASCAKDCPATTPVCGNSKCDPGETSASCPKDCPSTTPVCGNSKCDPGETTASCPKDCPATGPVCGDKKCEGDEIEMCPADCTTGPVCGNNKCESGETTANCKQDCPGTTTGKCGDAKCESGESTTCPMDCNSSYNPTVTCGISKCSSQWTACLNDAKCKGMFNCAAMCDCNESCIKECATGMETNGAAIGIVTCASNNKCPDPCGGTSKCGNGTCDAGESPSTCPSDCKTTSPVCGNGKCESGETKTNCPMDCGGTTTGHPCDTACGGKAPSGCYCDAECMNAGDCCDAAGQPAGKSCTGSTCGTCQAP